MNGSSKHFWDRKQIVYEPEIVTKHGSLHSASTWPPFRSYARSVALNLHPPPAPDFQPTGFTP